MRPKWGDWETTRGHVTVLPLQDGSLVPVTLFHSASVEASRRTPLLLHVYGSYGLDLGMDFCPQKTLLLEGGWALAYCHIRYRLSLTLSPTRPPNPSRQKKSL